MLRIPRLTLGGCMDSIDEHILAPAKINLFLRILGRRADGYHLLDSLMLPISLYDHVLVRLAPSHQSKTCEPVVTVVSDSAEVPNGPLNLAHRAAVLLLTSVGVCTSVDISIRKRIPVGSGMGGGSSDAAAVLLALNRLLGSPHGPDELAALGAQLGADVAFFVHGRPACIGGIGERVTPVRLRDALPLVVCWDGTPLATKRVYSLVDLSLTTGKAATSIEPLIGGRALVSNMLVNDLEAAAVKIHPEVLSLKVRLVEQGALGALMTGSGSAVFGIWPDHERARSAAVRLRQFGLWAEAVCTLEQSPAV